MAASLDIASCRPLLTRSRSQKCLTLHPKPPKQARQTLNPKHSKNSKPTPVACMVDRTRSLDDRFLGPWGTLGDFGDQGVRS